MRSRRGRPPHPGPVTPAEERVLELVRKGLPNAEIAIQLGLSVNTVRYHVSNLLAKANVKTRADLRGWQPPPEPPDNPRTTVDRLPMMMGLTRWAGVAACLVGVVAGVVAFSSFRLDEDSAVEVPTLPQSTETPPVPLAAIVVGDVQLTAHGYQITEAATQQVFELDAHPRLRAAEGQRVAVLGRMDGSHIETRKVELLGEGRVVNCWGVLRREGSAYRLDGGVCKGVEIVPAEAAAMLSFVSEKVNVPVAACSVTRNARLDTAPVSLFSDPIRPAC